MKKPFKNRSISIENTKLRLHSEQIALLTLKHLNLVVGASAPELCHTSESGLVATQQCS
jgi:hypothetical protein